MSKAKYSDKPEPVRVGSYRLKSIPAREELGRKTQSEWWVTQTGQIRLWETMHVRHHQTKAQAVAAVNYAGNVLYRRFKTHEVEPGVIAVWRVE